ncbi:MAG TPA: hypothetical protein VGT78_03220 [Rhizomicrobium sp.]|nr:hypothetical protein [Rhizomicrobium sp.]
MTEEEYWAEVRRLGLVLTNVPNVYRDQSGEHHNVPDPSKYDFADRVKIIRKLKQIMGVSI